MNKQEAIKELMSKAREITFGEDDNVYLSRNRTVELISQIDEPQKVVVPKFVAEWIEECKDKNSILYFAMNPNRTPKAVNEWLTYDGNDDVFARAWLDGYEVEKEKLYTIEIPDPNAGGYSIVLGRREGKVQIKQALSTTWEMNCSNQLTEAEIRKDFGWAWDAGFAKPVEVE